MITVIGSINMDLVIQTNHFPQQGETVLGTDFQTVPGGKGANQAVAAARLGSEVKMIAHVGEDIFGEQLIQNLQLNQIDVNGVSKVKAISTGVANILLHNHDNRIIVIPGANHALTIEYVAAYEHILQQSKLVILQLEIPVDVVEFVIHKCATLHIPVLLNPAPAEGFNKKWMEHIAYCTPNETECADIFGVDVESALRSYPNKLIVTAGREGALYCDGENIIKVTGYKTTAVDTTGAGDTFNGALAHALVSGKSLKEAIYYANIAASLSVEKFGAQGGLPTNEAVEYRIANSQQS